MNETTHIRIGVRTLGKLRHLARQREAQYALGRDIIEADGDGRITDSAMIDRLIEAWWSHKCRKQVWKRLKAFRKRVHRQPFPTIDGTPQGQPLPQRP